MSESSTIDPIAIRDELRRWIDAAWDPELGLVEWRRRLADGGWACPTWPREWGGRSLPAALADVVADELANAGVPGPPDGVGMHLAAPTILEHGSDDLKRRFLRPTVTGEMTWCQLFSEPGAGSDLAGLTTRAERHGDEWSVSGQKVWSTGAAHAEFGLLLARTDWDVPKHRGIAYFILPMRQQGVEVRPLRQMNGHASFNEVFLDDAHVPASNVIGQVGDGWKVALTTLAHERRLAPVRRIASQRRMSGRAWDEAIAERIAVSEPHKWYPQRAGRPDLVVERAVATGKARDPVVRQEIAKLIALAWAAKWTAQRAAVARALGRPPGPEGSLGKLASSNIARAAARVHALIADASGMLAGSDAPLDGTIAEIFLSVPAISIAGGTDEIQRTILAERILGLPKEPEADRDVPFRRVRRNGGTDLTATYLERDGVAVYYEIHGTSSDRTPLLLTHGYAASSAMWQPNIPAIAKTRRVIAWDMRGHGRTASPRDPARYSQELSVADMAAILDACGIGSAAIGGLSLGGYLSLAFHAAHRTRVAALLLCDAGPGFKQEKSREQWNTFAEARAEAFERNGLGALPTSPEVGPGAHDPAGLALAARGILTQHDSRVLDSLPLIRVPTLIVVGENDEPFLAAADYMATKIPGATKTVIRNAGHASNIDQPGAFNAAVTGFLDHLD